MATEKPQGNLAFGAALIHGMGLLALGIVYATNYALGQTHEFSFAIVAVAGATTGVALFWSLLLAYRAHSAEGLSRWIGVIFVALMLELAALCGLLWGAVYDPSPYRIVNSAVWLGLPVFGPFLTLTSMYAVPLAVRRARKVDADEAELGIPDRKRSGFVCGVKRYALVVVVSGVFLIPVPLFLLGACAAQFYDDEANEPKGWGSAVADSTPNFIRDSVELLMQKQRTDSDFCYRAWVSILWCGYVSKEKLEQRLYDEANGATYAWSGLKRKHPDTLSSHALKIGMSPDRLFSEFNYNAAIWLARHGSTAQIEQALNKQHTSNASFRRTFLQNIDPEKLSDSSLELLRILAIDDVDRAEVLHLLSVRASPESLKSIWLSYLNSETTSLRKEAARHMVACIQRGVPEIVVEYLKSTDKVTRGTAVLQLAVYREGLRPHVFRNAQNTRYVSVTRRLLELLDDPDDVIKLSAMCVLSDIFREGDAPPEVLASATEKIQQYDVPSHQIKLDDAERAEIQAVRAAVQAFLDSTPRP